MRSVRPTFSRIPAAMRSAPIAKPDVRRAYLDRHWPSGDPSTDPSLLDEEFDDLGCDAQVLLRVVNQP